MMLDKVKGRVLLKASDPDCGWVGHTRDIPEAHILSANTCGHICIARYSSIILLSPDRELKDRAWVDCKEFSMPGLRNLDFSQHEEHSVPSMQDLTCSPHYASSGSDVVLEGSDVSGKVDGYDAIRRLLEPHLLSGMQNVRASSPSERLLRTHCSLKINCQQKSSPPLMCTVSIYHVDTQERICSDIHIVISSQVIGKVLDDLDIPGDYRAYARISVSRISEDYCDPGNSPDTGLVAASQVSFLNAAS